MLSSLIISSLLVFSIVLLITKSKVMACKRDFVEKRYKAAFVNDQKPHFVHRCFHAFMTCPMCSGMYVSAITVLFMPITCNYLVDIMLCFGTNWLLHCLENFLFNFGKILTDDFDVV